MAERIKSFVDLGAIKGQFLTDAKAAAIFNFVCSYQSQHDHATPTYAVIANNVGVPEEAVKQLLGRLESKRLIHVVSRNPLKIVVIDKDELLPHEKGSTGEAEEGAYERFLGAEAARMSLGRFIAAKEAIGDHISLRDMAEHVGIDSLAYVSRMAEILCQRGLIQYGPRLRTALTKKGREFFRVAPTQPVPEPDQPRKEIVIMEQHKPNVVVLKTPKASRSTREHLAHRLCQYLAATSGMVRNGERHNDIAVALGYGSNSGSVVGEAARFAMEHGWIAPQPMRVRGIQLTEKGMKKFGPRTPAPAAEVEEPEVPGFGVEQSPEPTREPEPPEPTTADGLAHVPTAELIMELTERGYNVRKN